jgi:hypothetical protein
VIRKIEARIAILKSISQIGNVNRVSSKADPARFARKVKLDRYSLTPPTSLLTVWSPYSPFPTLDSSYFLCDNSARPSLNTAIFFDTAICAYQPQIKILT